jgi:hypothetical protein
MKEAPVTPLAAVDESRGHLEATVPFPPWQGCTT